MRILLLEDDLLLSQTLVEILSEHGFEVTPVYNGEEAIELTYQQSYDMYLFDINLPDMSGIELLQSLKDADDQTPAIFISANIDIETIAKGFEVGAEDYIKKPFMPEELLIRLNAKLAKKMVIHYKNISYNTLSGDIFIDKERLYLSYAKFKIFDMLFRNIGKVVSKETLLDVSEYGSNKTLRVTIAKFKTLLDIDIKNIRGVGYTIETR